MDNHNSNKLADQDTTESAAQPGPVESLNARWQLSAMNKCPSLSYCANPYGAAWRFRVTKAERQAKRRGQCLCKEFASRQAEVVCDLTFGHAPAQSPERQHQR